MNDNNLFGISIIRVYETKMLTYNDFLNLANKNSYDDVVEELTKRDYFKYGVTPDSAIYQKETELYNKLESLQITLPMEFFLENDFFNIEVSAKAVYKGINPETYLNIHSSKQSKNLHKDEDKCQYSFFFKKALELLENGKNCEEYLKNKLAETAEEISKNSFFLNWFRIVDKFKTPDVNNENIKIDYLKSHKYNSFSIAPVFGFYYGNLIELRNLRTVLFGKKSGAKTEEITERLCKTYV